MFMACARIEESLKNKSTAECLVWCAENKLALRKHKVRTPIVPSSQHMPTITERPGIRITSPRFR